jgi:hypothetical protein
MKIDILVDIRTQDLANKKEPVVARPQSHGTEKYGHESAGPGTKNDCADENQLQSRHLADTKNEC